MLKNCPECQLQVSDKAIICPHCGYPLNENINKKSRHATTKHKKLPNGFGQISEIKNQYLRKPFRAMVCVGKDEYGKPISKPLKPETYFKTYNEAYTALVEYHKNPVDLDNDLSVQDLYERWSEYYFKTLKSDSSIRTLTCAWKYMHRIYKMRVIDVKPRHLKDCVENASIIYNKEEKLASANIKGRIKSLMNLMFDYAVEYDLIDINPARNFELSKNIIEEREENHKGHMPFKDEEMQKLWDAVNIIDSVDILLIQCYSGWRPQELGLIKLTDVNINDGYFIGGMKTAAGKDRVVPIHSKILPLVKLRYYKAMKNHYEYLFDDFNAATHKENPRLTYDKYRYRVKEIFKRLELNPNHKAHDGRMHFITQCKKYKVDEYAIKYMVGHAINDVTEKVYTEREVEWLKEEIEKIK